MKPLVPALRRKVLAWLGQRSPRERLLLAVAGAALVLYGGIVGVAWPVLAVRSASAARIAQSDAGLARLAAAPAAPLQAQDAGPATTVLTDTAPEFGLEIRLLAAEGAGVRVELADAVFDDVLRWIDALQRSHALRPVSVEMDRRADPGVVGARLVLAR